MHRTIRFRGIPVGKKEFVYGFYRYNQDDDIHIIYDMEGKPFEVGHATVGQFTGMQDHLGIDIYEGDVCKVLYSDWPSKSDDDPRTLDQYLTDISKIGVITWLRFEWGFVIGGCNESIFVGKHGLIQVIGTVHTHPELIK